MNRKAILVILIIALVIVVFWRFKEIELESYLANSNQGSILSLSTGLKVAHFIGVDGSIQSIVPVKSSQFGGKPIDARLSHDCTVVVMNKEHGIARFDISGKELWSKPGVYHHDWIEMEDGSFWTIKREKFSVPELSFKEIANDLLVRIDDSQETREISLYPLLKRYIDPKDWLNAKTFLPKDNSIRSLDDTPLDPFHINSVVLIPKNLIGNDSRLLMFSSKYLNRIFMLDLVEEEIIWEWGKEELDGPHSPVLTPDGTIMVLDNGLNRKFSRVLEVDPVSKRIIWEASDRDKARKLLTTMSRGNIQILPNGNLFLAISDHSHFLELNRAGKLVWGQKFVPQDALAAAGSSNQGFYRAQFIDSHQCFR